MAQTRFRQAGSKCVLFGLIAASLAAPGRAQQTRVSAAPPAPAARPAFPVVTLEQPDAERTRKQMSELLRRYPPALRTVLSIDPRLLDNQDYLSPYPALAAFLNTHPEVAHNPSFYISGGFDPRLAPQRDAGWAQLLDGLGVFAGFGMAIGLLTWLIRTLIDYRRWSRLSKVQTDVHTKLLDRFTANDDLLAYIQSPAGSGFLQSSPIMLDAGPRNISAPVGRILWSIQAGLVLVALGIGLQVVSGRASADAAQSIHGLGVIGIALGLGFVISAIISFMISHRLGLIEQSAPRPETPGVHA